MTTADIESDLQHLRYRMRDESRTLSSRRHAAKCVLGYDNQDAEALQFLGRHDTVGGEPLPSPVDQARHDPNYTRLRTVLDNALLQAACGKGAERHANALPFERQPMQTIADQHGIGFILGQAAKKMVEARGMLGRGESDAAERELLGAINYLAGAVIFIDRKQGA